CCSWPWWRSESADVTQRIVMSPAVKVGLLGEHEDRSLDCEIRIGGGVDGAPEAQAMKRGVGGDFDCEVGLLVHARPEDRCKGPNLPTGDPVREGDRGCGACPKWTRAQQE